MKFPEDFVEIPHFAIKGATHWLYPNEEEETIISIIGGSDVLISDGINTFEMWDKREEHPQGIMTKDQINEWLESHPITT